MRREKKARWLQPLQTLVPSYSARVQCQHPFTTHCPTRGISTSGTPRCLTSYSPGQVPPPGAVWTCDWSRESHARRAPSIRAGKSSWRKDAAQCAPTHAHAAPRNTRIECYCPLHRTNQPKQTLRTGKGGYEWIRKMPSAFCPYRSHLHLSIGDIGVGIGSPSLLFPPSPPLPPHPRAPPLLRRIRSLVFSPSHSFLTVSALAFPATPICVPQKRSLTFAAAAADWCEEGAKPGERQLRNEGRA